MQIIHLLEVNNRRRFPLTPQLSRFHCLSLRFCDKTTKVQRCPQGKKIRPWHPLFASKEASREICVKYGRKLMKCIWSAGVKPQASINQSLNLLFGTRNSSRVLCVSRQKKGAYGVHTLVLVNILSIYRYMIINNKIITTYASHTSTSASINQDYKLLLLVLVLVYCIKV